MTTMTDAATGERKIVAGKALWASSAVLGALATFAVCFPAWPGHFGYDPLYAYRTSITGIENMVWPPVHAYMFWVSRHLGLGAGGLFAAQVFILFFSAALSLGLLLRRRALAIAAAVGFFGLFILTPPLFGVAMSQWRDVPTGSFAMLAVGLWLCASAYRAWGFFVGAAVALAISVSLRYNAFPLFTLIAPLMVAQPFLGRTFSWRERGAAALTLVLCLGLAVASTQWRLPDLKRVDAANTQFTIQLFDLLGVSACSNESFVPPQLTGGVPLSGAQARELYDPRHAQMAYGPHAGVPQLDLTVPRTAELIDEAWRQAIPTHFGCYFAHRNIVFVEQLGLEKHHIFYPVHGAIDPNEFGLKLAHPSLSAAVTAYVIEASKPLWRRPFWLYVFAGVATLALLARRDPRSVLCLAVLGGAYGNVALLYLIGPAADARYIFPSNVLCAFLIALAAGIMLERGPASARATTPVRRLARSGRFPLPIRRGSP